MKVISKKTFFILLMVILITRFLYSNGRNTDENNVVGYKIVFIVDVSKKSKPYGEIVREIVSKISRHYDNPEKNEMHLITFSDKVNYYRSKQTFELIEANVDMELTRNKSPNGSLSKQALSWVFDLIASGFSQKKNLILFISDGKDMDKTDSFDDYQQTIKALENNGFKLFSIWVDTKQKNSCETCMERLAHIAGTNPHTIDEKEDVIYLFRSLRKEFQEENIPSPVSKHYFQDKQSEWSSERCLYIIGLVLLGMLFLTLMPTIYITTRKKYKKMLKEEIDFLKNPLKMLWGKIEKYDTQNNSEEEPIPLNEQGAEYILDTPAGYPDVYFSAGNFKNKKAIKVEEHNGEGRVELCDENGKPCYKKYIGYNTVIIKIHPFESAGDNLHTLEYKYIFLNRLSEMCNNAVDKPELFIENEGILFQIKENFLADQPNCKNLIITGIKNAGKTSLLKHLAGFYFKEEDELAGSCVVDILERDIVRNMPHTEFEESFEAKINGLKKSKTKRKILFVDDYDDNFDEFGDTFRELLDNYRIETDPREKIYFVLAGKRPRGVHEEAVAGTLSEHFKELVLEGAKSDETPSIEPIDLIFDEIGFQRDNMANELKVKAMIYASGLPYFYKSILLELLKKWEDDFVLKLESINFWDEILIEVKNNYTEYFSTVRDNYDRAPKNTRTDIRFDDIFNYISKNGMGTGSVPEEDMESYFLHEKENDKLRSTKEKSFKSQLALLIKFGLVKRDPNGYLVGIPYLFYYQGGEFLEAK